MFSDHGSVTGYVDSAPEREDARGHRVGGLGDTPEALAESLLAALLEHRLAEVLEEKPVRAPERPAPVPIPEKVFWVIDSMRRSRHHEHAGPTDGPAARAGNGLRG
jgi:hypothetical protein